MVRNDFVIDFKALLRKESKTMEDLGEILGVTRAAISKRAMGTVMNKGYVELCDALGYDIEVKYIKRETE